MAPPQLSIPSSVSGQRYLFREAYSILEQAIAGKVFPGAAFSVLAGKEILALDGVGKFTYEPGSASVTAATIYDLASITKVLATTSMAMLLYDRGQLRLDDRLAQWLPAFAGSEAAAGPRNRVSLRMLLTHSSGLPGYARLFETCRDRASVIEACLKLPLDAAPGERAEYSDPGFLLLGQALEEIAGESIDAFSAREIFAPLGMSSTRFRPPAEWRSAIAPTEEDLAFRHRIIQGEVQDENCFVLGGVSGHAGLFSNALDPLRYAAACTIGQEVNCRADQPGQSILAPETIRLFTTRAGEPPGSSRALGWDTPAAPSSSGSFFSSHSAGHLGFSGTSLWIDFDRPLAIVLLTNRTWPHRESEGIRQVRPAFHDAIRKAIGAVS